MPPRLPLLFQIPQLGSIPHLTCSAPPPLLPSPLLLLLLRQRRAEGSDVSLYKSPTTPPPPLLHHHHQQHRYNHHNHNPNLLNLHSHKLHQQNLIASTSHIVNTPFSSFITSLSFTRSSSSTSIATATAPTSTITSTPITTTTATAATTATTTTTMSAAKVQKLIDENPVVVFSKSYCPYCKASKALLTEKGAKFEVLELDQIADGADIQAALKDLTGQTTVPNIFIGQKHIGGNSDLQGRKDELPQLLAAAGAV